MRPENTGEIPTSKHQRSQFATLLSLLLITLITASAITVGSTARAQSSQGKVPSPTGLVFNSASDFTNDPTAPGIGTIDHSSCTDGTDLGGGNIRVNCDATNLPHNELSIAVDPANPNHIVAGSNDYELFFVGSTVVQRVIAGYYTSFDGGTTWTNGHIAPGGFTFNGDPAIAFNTKFGLVDYATIASNGGQAAGFATATIQVNTSNDGGLTFGNPVIVALGTGGTRTTVFQDKPYIAVDNNPSSPYYGRVYVTNTRFLFNSQGQYLESPIQLTISDDGGHKFSTPQIISGTSTSLCSQPVISPRNNGICNEDQDSVPVVGADGTLYVAFVNDEHAQSPSIFRDQYLIVKSTDGGVTFSTPVSAVFPIFDGSTDYPINVDGRQTLSNSQFRLSSAGNLAIDPSSGPTPSTTRLYISFSDNRNGLLTGNPATVITDNDVFVVASSNGGASWTGPVRVPGGNGSTNDQFYPWAAVSNTGIVKVAFMDRSYDPANIQYGITLATSTNHGASFSSAQVDTGLSNPNDSRWFTNGGTTNGKSTFLGDYNGLAIGSDGKAHPAWTDSRVSAFPSPPPGRGHKTQDAVTASV